MKVSPKQVGAIAIAAALGWLVYGELLTRKGRSRFLTHKDCLDEGFAIFNSSGEFLRCEDLDGNIVPDSVCAKCAAAGPPRP